MNGNQCNTDVAKSSCDETNQYFFNPYKIILKRKIIDGFDGLNRGNFSAVTKLFAEDVRYWFAGDNALGGERCSRAGCERWFMRLLRLLPSHFTIQQIGISGMPWNTIVHVRFRDEVRPMIGSPYSNEGMQLISLRWGKAVSIRTYVDTEKVSKALRLMTNEGIAEAAAEPISCEQGERNHG